MTDRDRASRGGVLRAILRPARGLVIVSTLAGLVSGGAGVALIRLLQQAISAGGSTPADPARVAALFAGLCLLTATTRLLAQGAMIRLAHGAAGQLAVRVCRTVLDLPLARFERVDHAQLLAVLTEDIGTVAGTIAALPLATANAAIVATCLVYVGTLAPIILVWAAVCGAGAGLVHHLTTRRAVGDLRAARSRQDALVDHYRTLVGGFRELKQHRDRREAFLAEALAVEADAVRDRLVAGLTRFALAAAWGQLAFFGFIGVVVFILPHVWPISPAALAGAVLVLLYLLVPLDVLLVWSASLARARTALARIDALMPTLVASEPVDPSTTGPTEAPALRAAIRFSGVEYHYGGGGSGGGAGGAGEGFRLGPLDLTIRRGEILMIAGGNGSGKTTLMKLLAGLYQPDAGVIRLDGRPVDAGGWERYRQLFAVVFADGHLFREVRGSQLSPTALAQRARDLLARLGLDHQVAFDGQSFTTVDLSVGQRRRLALLTACLEDRPICLLDEWAANQDPAFKAIFYRTILPELRSEGRTLVVISHDNEFHDVADRVVHLRDGRIVAEARAALEADTGPAALPLIGLSHPETLV